jgi:hypothetical protein
MVGEREEPAASDEDGGEELGDEEHGREDEDGGEEFDKAATMTSMTGGGDELEEGTVKELGVENHGGEERTVGRSSGTRTTAEDKDDGSQLIGGQKMAGSRGRWRPDLQCRRESCWKPPSDAAAHEWARARKLGQFAHPRPVLV